MAVAVRRELQRLEPMVAAEGLTWEDLRQFLGLRNELLEADTRFGQLGESGVFEQLDQAGVLTHRLTRNSPARDPLKHPPEGGGRARIRGEWVGKLWKEGAAGRYRSDWTAMWDETTGRLLDLSDPFVVKAEWQ